MYFFELCRRQNSSDVVYFYVNGLKKTAYIRERTEVAAMISVYSEHDIFLRPNSAEQVMTGLHNFGYNDFFEVKPIKFVHSQPFETLHIVLSGKGSYHLCGKTYFVKEGDMFFTPADTPLCYYPDSDEPWSYVWYAVNAGVLSEYISLLEVNAQAPVKRIKNAAAVKGVITKLLEELKTIPSQPVFCCLAAFMQVLALEAMEIESEEDSKAVYIRSIKKYIEDNYRSQDFTVDALCDMMHLSHSYICRIFSSVEGCTVISYIETLRLNKAAELLRDTKLSVNSIAGSVGYKDSLHFMKRFKKHFGVTALEYRKK